MCYCNLPYCIQLSGRLTAGLSVMVHSIHCQSTSDSCEFSRGNSNQCLLRGTSRRKSGHRLACASTQVATLRALSGMQCGAHGELPHPRSGPVRHVCDVQARPLRHPRGAQWRRKRGPSAVQDVDPSWPRLEAESRILQAVRVDWWLVSRRLHEGHHPVDSG